ncbi:origin recognition complex, subunit 2 [Earliella scabrosa]|nr:origin recognition complex, subunit 2 [Earliella scabrosa]
MLSDDTDMPYDGGDDTEDLEEWPTSEPATPSTSRLSFYDDDEDFVAPDEPAPGFATHTAFDAYFLQASKPSRTSSNVFSALVPPLSSEEYSSVLKKLQADPRETERILWRDPATRKACFRRFKTELDEGFNLMMYGYGSKREFLNAFAQHLARSGAHVVVANGFQPRFSFKDLLSAIERVPGVLEGPSTTAPAASTSTSASASQDAQTQRIHAFFSTPDSPHLYLIIHNIEGNAFRASKARAALALLALAPHIHVIASVDHIAASQRWSLSELFARKPDPAPPSSSSSSTSSASAPSSHSWTVPNRGFAWLWHDLTTLAPYDFELAFADPTSLSGVAALRGTRISASAAALAAAGAGGGAGGGQAGALVSETAARHVIASVTQKAKKLFVLLGAKQLEVMPVAGANDSTAQAGGGGGGGGEGEGAYDYDRLFAAARDAFVATNDTALRALLGEFRDHGLVVSVGGGAQGGAEAMWIPMRREALAKIVGELKAEGH